MAIRGFIVGLALLAVSLVTYAGQSIHPSTCSTKAAAGTVALTFDDGPSPIYTKKILTILKKYHIHATFFIVGERAKVYPKFLRKIVAEGNVIGNHSMTHPQVSKLKDEQLYDEIVASAEIISKIIGKKTQLFRFPYGAENVHVHDYVVAHGMKPVRWGYSTEDYRLPGVDNITNGVIQHARSGQIILMHDGPTRRQQTVMALPRIIEGIKKKGLGFSVLCG